MTTEVVGMGMGGEDSGDTEAHLLSHVPQKLPGVPLICASIYQDGMTVGCPDDADIHPTTENTDPICQLLVHRRPSIHREPQLPPYTFGQSITATGT
jgi:hypothetical protein